MSYWNYGPADDALILRLRDKEGCAFTEIARRLDWPYTRVFNRYRTLKAVEVSGSALKYSPPR